MIFNLKLKFPFYNGTDQTKVLQVLQNLLWCVLYSKKINLFKQTLYFKNAFIESEQVRHEMLY